MIWRPPQTEDTNYVPLKWITAVARILLFTSGPKDWKPLLAHPEKHWSKGYSARTLAYSWEAADGLPREIAEAFASSSEPTLSGLEPILAIPELKVDLPGGKRPSQNDVFVLARSAEGAVVIMVEGKVKESFGPTLSEWEAKKSDGRKKRLRFLRDTLGLTKVKGSIRYQLLHRAASALITGVQYRAAAAVLCVHSFDVPAKGGDQAGWKDYVAFAALFGSQAEAGKVQRLPGKTSVPLFGLWVAGNLDYTKR